LILYWPDRQVLPHELASHFSEKPVYLNTSFIPLVAHAAHPQAPARKDFGIAEYSFVMGAFGNTYKITPVMFAVWMRLLQRIPGSSLWLIDDNAQTTANLQREAQALGVAPERILFAPVPPMPSSAPVCRWWMSIWILDPDSRGSTT
jgi:predicted O-linked N-acetylglucosamine transferase (SPINDLY family)